MSSIPALNDEQWLQLLEHVAKNFNEVTLSRGFTYFKQQHVLSLAVSEDRAVRARVTGSEDYTVSLKLNKLHSSSCTCPVEDNCKHQAAVIMELADRWGYPASQIVNAKHYLKRIASTPSSITALKQLPETDVFGWHKFLDSYTSQITPSYDPGIYADVLRHQMQAIRKAGISFSAIDWVYFELHQELFIVRKIKEHTAQSGANYYTSFSLYRLYDEIHVWIQRKSALFNLTLSKDRLNQTLSYIREQMAEETGHKYLDYGLYTAMWKYWIAPQPEPGHWASQEINSINNQTTESISASLSAAKAFLYLHQSKSKEAWEALEAGDMLKKVPASLFLPFLNQISGSRNWGSLVDWLIKTAPNFYGQRNKEIDAYVGYWTEAVTHLPEAARHLWSILEGMLPHTMQVIEDLLYEQRNWKLWIEMQIVQDHDPRYHRVSVLQPIEKDAPELLLPYYHQYIDRFVALKNRHDYKIAVKLLKRLEKVYKKMKQVERWDRFFTGFTERYSRLRALQEEMKKGKLLE